MALSVLRFVLPEIKSNLNLLTFDVQVEETYV